MNNTPLAERMRPEDLEGFFGQEELMGKKSFLRQAIEGDQIPSMVFWGPPGSGKTTLARIIANKTDSEFVQMSATSSGLKDLREIVEKAEQGNRLKIRTILFIDEIHRWNKRQQDALLPHVEKGTVTLIGATTENPSFEVNSALISRSRVFVLKKLGKEAIVKILERPIKELKLKINKEVIELIAGLANGDARMALNTLEAASKSGKKITKEEVKEVLQKSHLLYDKHGEEHYNIISALHKSMRGGDADAAVYWLARMLEGGEDPLYIARRLMNFAAEDVGLANNTALLLANAAYDSAHKMGMPECNLPLAQCVIYLAKCKKDRTVCDAYFKARQDVEQHGNLEVPLSIRNAPTDLMKDLGYGSGDQQFMPDELKDKKYL